MLWPLSGPRAGPSIIGNEAGGAESKFPKAMCEGDIVNVPASLRAAISGPANGRIALVLGAGCSIDAPTSLKTAGDYAALAHRRLVAENIVAEGCCDPRDLGRLADAVFDATGSQKHLVDILKPELVNAAPNDGHKIAAALLAEQILGLILTLNFDRAIDAAVATMAHGSAVTIVHSVADLSDRTRFGVIYLHGDVEAPEEAWILRTAQIDASWDDTWQQYVVVDLALTPNVVFAGLGSPTPVISETVLKVKTALPAAKRIYQVDKIDRARNLLAEKLEVAADDYVVSCWTGFMRAVGDIVARDILNKMSDRHPSFCADNHHEVEDVSMVIGALPSDILSLGKLRAAWFMDRSEYKAFYNTNLDHLVDIVRALAIALEIVDAAECVLVEDGMEFRREGRVLFRVFSYSGAGSAYWAKAEAEMLSRVQKFRRSDKTTPVVYLVTAAEMDQATSVPEKIVPERNTDEVTASPRDFAYLSATMLKNNPKMLMDMLRN